MTIKNFFRLLPAISAASVLTLSSCGNKGFTIEGNIEGASDAPVVMERADFSGQWRAIDSTRTDANGNFTINHERMPNPEIFRIVYNGQYIYLPVDSTETVTLKAKGASFVTDYELAGSSNAKNMAEFDKEIYSLKSSLSDQDLEDFKKQVYVKYIQPDPSSILSYYILTRSLGDKQLFDPEISGDYRYFGAVATAYNELKPDDPRTTLLKQASIDSRKKHNTSLGKYQQYVAEELSFPDIDLPDEKGERKKLSETVAHGKPTVLVFSQLTSEDGPKINYDIEQLRKKNPDNINIYQVSLDSDRYAWREAASNLNWTTVYDPDGEYSKAAADYNVTVLPTFFIINSKGELTDRLNNLNEAESKLK